MNSNGGKGVSPGWSKPARFAGGITFPANIFGLAPPLPIPCLLTPTLVIPSSLLMRSKTAAKFLWNQRQKCLDKKHLKGFIIIMRLRGESGGRAANNKRALKAVGLAKKPILDNPIQPGLARLSLVPRVGGMA